MASCGESQFSLLNLEDELTCSICLSPFDYPVTIPCGHNFCQDCLLSTWKDDFYSCPQCRTFFATKPELKKNTVLCTVVETFNLRSSKSTASLQEEVKKPEEEKKEDVIRCDTCMEAEAEKTCLTCMASFCEEHLRPHRENPIFRLHHLSEPVGDLMERICPDHHKLMELFCSQHERLICSLCLQQVHKGCSFSSPEEQRNLKESDLRAKLGLLDGKISKNGTIISEMKEVQTKLKDSAASRKKAVALEFLQMRDMLRKEEQDALNALDREVEGGQTKLRGLMTKFSENIENMNKAKEDIHNLLSQSQTLAFLQTSFNLPQAVNFEPHTPRINLDSKKVLSFEDFAVSLKKHLTEILKQPVEARAQMLRASERPASVLGWTPLSFGASQQSVPLTVPRPQSPDQPAKAAQKKKTQKNAKKPSQSTGGNMGNKNQAKSMENLLQFSGKDKPKGCPAAGPKEPPAAAAAVPTEISNSEKRIDLLKYGTVLTFDPRTAHKRIVLSEGFTKASVSDEHINYPDCPERFAVCSQVLTSKGFSTGRHYWEVRLSSNNFIGVGLAYSSIDRKGPTSRLGRSPLSWCVEWFNVKLSAWYNSTETVLVNPNPKRVGVLLDCEEGKATFYNVADRAYPFYSFMFPFGDAIYPAFWIFSCGSSITLCKLQ
ncbi:E3 ubiquitin/ISG15 ligase TRIM25 isoform X2 [Melanotaenia boesemani]|uniref:E3 ubiquitin/ISG15 ligase TRIM25 isoform X2 n=1 Tax=Melanotaenia boesemani TaxID=1250792 RepID=UPI001C055DD0|nr:E3 ubiquitin/ISG15 ligase TRIM25 isoform X2 [Melanotaenia boesemani]